MTTYNIHTDLKKCTQISISFQNGRECLIRKVGENTFSVEMENPHNEYPHMSAGNVMSVLPCSGIVNYKVHLPGELPADKQRFINSLFPKLCDPDCKEVKAYNDSHSISAKKLPDGNWMMSGNKCTIVTVVHAIKNCADTPLTTYFQKNNEKPVKI